MSTRVTILDYGSGNLFSVQRALEHCGATPVLSHDPDEILAAERLILPGVGAFANGIQGLRERGLVNVLYRYAQSGKPLLGICLGMQMLASISEEFGTTQGLNLIPGRVVPIPSTGTDGAPIKIPNIGWADLIAPECKRSWARSILADLAPASAVYLVHSFHFVPDDPAHRLADCLYGGHRICAAVQAGSIIGCQFHPEKSGPIGLSILSSFLRMQGESAP